MSDERPPLHRQVIEDCPTSAKNYADGWRPFLRVEFLSKEGEEEVILHCCGMKDPRDLTDALRLIAQELADLLGSAKISFEDEDQK